MVLVDDEDDIRTIGELALGTVGGWEVHSARSGHEALELARAIDPAVVLLDVMMPVMDGPATLAQFRDDPVLSKLPVIFMTAKVQPAEVSRYLELGAVGVIRKPFDPMKLASQIDAILAEHEAADAPRAVADPGSARVAKRSTET